MTLIFYSKVIANTDTDARLRSSLKMRESLEFSGWKGLGNNLSIEEGMQRHNYLPGVTWQMGGRGRAGLLGSGFSGAASGPGEPQTHSAGVRNSPEVSLGAAAASWRLCRWQCLQLPRYPGQDGPSQHQQPRKHGGSTKTA